MGRTIGLGRIWSFVFGFRSLVARLTPFKRESEQRGRIFWQRKVWTANFSATMVRQEVWREKRKVRFFGKGKCELTAIASMQNKLCDVTKCLTTVAAGVPGTSRPRSEEEAWNWVVVRGSTARPADFFWSSPFLRYTMPSRASCYVPEGTNVKKCANGASFRVNMYSWSNDVFVELMGEEDAKTPVLYVGNCLFTGS